MSAPADPPRRFGSVPLPAGEQGPAPTGPLQPIETATAALLGAMTMLFVVAGSFLPHASAIAALGTVPTGVVAYRHRPRAVAASIVAAVTVGFLVAGSSVLSSIVACGLIGGVAGHAHRRRWGPGRLLAAVAVIAPVVGLGVVAVLLVLAELRTLTLHTLRNGWRGLAGFWRFVGLPGVTAALDRWIDRVIVHWELTVFVAMVAGVVAGTAAAWWMLAGLLHRLDAVGATDRLAAAAAADRGPAAPVPAAGLPGPVPVRLEGVGVRYPGATRPALEEITLTVAEAEALVLAGTNGSGKSTLARVLAGSPPTDGTVARPGRVGLGELGGTALISQRPESQVLGVRVRDDVVWGLPADLPVAVDALLAAVGLAGMADRDTSDLSGGQLQRLAVAAALARRPRLLVSDEFTAMIDGEGRRLLMELLGQLPEARGVTVVHVTHRPEELAAARRVIRLDAGRLHAGPVLASPRPLPRPLRDGEGFRAGGRGALELVDVGHVYAAGTPWAHTALTGVSLAVAPGEGVLVVGDNGSGKSTLAWILAGLLRPSAGSARLDGDAVHRHVGEVGVAFQHARLQLQRSRVGADVRAAGGVARLEAEEALRLVGLEPAVVWDQSVDELSGGQARRVALAGLLARRPAVAVLDEPMAGLDGESRDALLEVLARMRAELGLTVIVISHDLEGMDGVCDRVVRLAAGRVVADGPLAAAPAPAVHGVAP